jgi:hypothetical protein
LKTIFRRLTTFFFRLYLKIEGFVCQKTPAELEKQPAYFKKQPALSGKYPAYYIVQNSEHNICFFEKIIWGTGRNIRFFKKIFMVE